MNHKVLLVALLVALALGLGVIAVDAQGPRPGSRRAPANSITVDTLADDNSINSNCTLREAIIAANTNTTVDACSAGDPSLDTITFGVTGTIILSTTLGSLPAITETLAINGPGASLLVINGNSAGFRVISVYTGTNASLSDLTIEKGMAIPGFGGAGILNYGTLTLTNASVLSNTVISAGLGGAGIYNDQGKVTLINSTFSGNLAGGSSGGGIYNLLGTLTVVSSTFSSNSATSGGGGGIYDVYGTVVISNSTLYSNTVIGGNGGAIYSLGALTMTNSTLALNGAPTGSAIYKARGGSPPPVSILNATIYSNNGGDSVFSLTTVMTFTNSIVGPSSGGFSCNTSGGSFVNGGNNIDGSSQCGWGSSNGSVSNTNALLAALTDNGGPTKTMAPLVGSPAINKANSLFCPSIDQRGIVRPQGPGCDVGAYEAVLNWLYLPVILR